MRFKPPLAQADLVAIQEWTPWAPTCALLWEVKRFRVLHIDQLQRILGTLPGPQGDVLQAICAHIEEEPCVK
jgi:hypothetical protein